jgi:hypothetical protein
MRQDLELLYRNASNPKMSKDKNFQPIEFIEPKLAEAEQLFALLKGTKQDPYQFVVFMLTDRGIHIFAKSGASASASKFQSGHEFMTFSTITGLNYKKVMMNKYGVEITRASNVDLVANLDESAAAEFVSKARDLIVAAQQPSASVVVAQESALDALKKLKELHDAGVVSDSEFEAKKIELMGRI